MKYQAHSDIDGLAFAAMRAMMLHEAEEHGLPVGKNDPKEVEIHGIYGKFGLEDRADHVRLSVASDRADHMFALRDSLVGHIEHFLPEVAARISWSDSVDEGALPPNFQFATVLSSTQLCQDFIRLELKLSHPERYDDPSIHFRFALPAPDNTDPEWPSIQANGGTAWPKGDKELHRPVYTARSMDRAKGTIVVDVFEHDGGRTTNWAKTVTEGETVAMIGPGGGGLLNTMDAILAGDETAYPAIARILDELPQGSAARVFLLSHNGATDYPMPDRPGVDIHWITGAEPKTLADEARESVAKRTADYFWIAAENSVVTPLRKDAVLDSIDKTNRFIAAFWNQRSG